MAMSYPLSLATTTIRSRPARIFQQTTQPPTHVASATHRTVGSYGPVQMEAHVPVVMIPIHVRIVGRHLR